MLVGCLAIIGAGVPLSTIGFSGYYSKDAIIEQAFSFGGHNPVHWPLQWAPVGGAFITAFYMFRLWYMTFAGKPRNQERYDHAHESPRVMTAPLVLLAVFALGIGWTVPGTFWNVTNLLDQARPVGTLATTHGELLPELVIPSEPDSHAWEIKKPAGIAAFLTAASGLLLATMIYFWDFGLRPAELKQTFKPIHSWLWNKWWFRRNLRFPIREPTRLLSRWISWFDLNIIDSIVHSMATISKGGSKVVDAVLDRTLVDGSVNAFARGTWDTGLWLRKIQTGSLRQYVMFIAVGTILLFVAISFVRNI